MAAPILQFRRGSSANIGIASFRAGEPGFTTNTYDFYIGLDGTQANQKFFGSARYWNKETATVGSSVRVVEGTNNGSNFIALKSPDSLAADVTYTLPVGVSTAGYILQNDGTGTLSWTPSFTGSINGITIREDGTTVGTAGSVTSVNFVGEGLAATASGAGATITLGAASATVAGVSSYSSSDFYFTNTYQVGVTTATTSTKGIASFNSTDFVVTGGFVGIATESIQDMAGSAITAGINTNITVTYDDANNRYNHLVNTATTSTLGVASFNATDFFVNAGAVGLNTESIQDMAGSAITAGINTNITVTYNDALNRIDLNVNTATTSTLGVASFNATDFFVNAGAVGLNTESIQDMTGSAITAGINTNITVVYDDANNRYNHFISTATSSVPGVASFSSSNFNVTGAGAVSIFYSPSAGFSTYATAAGIATYAPTAGFSTYATTAGIATYAPTAGIATYAPTAGFSTYTPTAGFSTYATTAGIATYTPTAGISTRTNTVDVTAAVAQTGGLVFATAGTGATLYNDAELTYDSSANRLTATNITASTEVRTAAVKATDGVSAITINTVTGNVGIASDLTVTGSLYVAGNTTQVNTTSLTVEDRVIELGKLATGATPPTDSTWDLGILFNYYTSSSNKKASVYWENGVSRFLFASDVTESILGINLPDSGAVGLGTTTPQLTSPVYAPIEVGALWLNDVSAGGTQTVVASYLTSGQAATELPGANAPAGRYLLNITVDAGTF